MGAFTLTSRKENKTQIKNQEQGGRTLSGEATSQILGIRGWWTRVEDREEGRPGSRMDCSATGNGNVNHARK